MKWVATPKHRERTPREKNDLQMSDLLRWRSTTDSNPRNQMAIERPRCEFRRILYECGSRGYLSIQAFARLEMRCTRASAFALRSLRYSYLATNDYDHLAESRAPS